MRERRMYGTGGWWGWSCLSTGLLVAAVRLISFIYKTIYQKSIFIIKTIIERDPGQVKDIKSRIHPLT